MAIRVDPNQSPRLIWEPSTEMLQQTLLSEVREWEDEPPNMPFESLIKSSGKQVLGGGVLVGITNQLQNAKLAFEPNTTSVSGGTATSTDTAGTLLTDIAATFEADGVVPGAVVINLTDTSVGTVTRVVSETELEIVALDDGTNNDWTIGDAYKVWNIIVCDATGGNLTALDSVGGPMTAVLPTAFNQVLLTAASDATLVESITPTDIADAVWDEILSGHAVAGSAGKILQEVLEMLENKLVINEATSEWWLYDGAGTSVIKKWPLKDKDGNNVILQGTGPADRGKRTL